MNTRDPKRGVGYLAGPRQQVRDFLSSLANLDDSRNWDTSLFLSVVPGLAVSISTKKKQKILCTLRDALRNVWRIKDLRTRQWGIHQILALTVFDIDKPAKVWPFSNAPLDLREPSSLEHFLTYMTNPRARPSVCRLPECQRPYYFARKPRQQYCSPDCAHTAINRSQAQWWDRTGSVRRERRRRKMGKERIKRPRRRMVEVNYSY